MKQQITLNHRRLARALERSQQVWNLDPDLAIGDFQTLQDRLARSVGPQQARMWLVGGFAALALALFGIYGLISYAVHQRLGEVGIRVALGAGGADIVRLFVRPGAALVCAGIAIGIAASLGLTQVLRSLLFETSPTDPLTLVSVVGLVAVTALAACSLPARKALRVDPSQMLRMH